LISGAFSLTRQAMALGYFPQVTIRHTASHTEGQIYIPEMNALLAVACLMLVLTFRESVKLAAAYGIAVTGTMAITSILFYVVARHHWHWPIWKAGGLLVFFLAIDLPFLTANLFKFFDGGYVPVLIGAILIAGMLIWMKGRTYLNEQHLNCYPTYADARDKIEEAVVARVPGTAVFLSPPTDHIPPILVHHVQRNRCLHQTVILLSVQTTSDATVVENARYKIENLDTDFHRVSMYFGFMEVPNIMPALERIASSQELPIDLKHITYYVGHETTVNSNAGNMGRIAESIFGYLQRNAVESERQYGMPKEQVLEIGTRVDL
ncbi:MAG: KUP/HAK/KT family potassium transporter, partial [Bryobacteraceae bacterium]|nr:KUP/HAK/KT family potassium transporter [Bryobacteraceae bacterium]